MWTHLWVYMACWKTLYKLGLVRLSFETSQSIMSSKHSCTSKCITSIGKMSEVKMKIKIGHNYLHLTDKIFFLNQLISNNMINGCDFQDLKAHSMDKKTFTKIKPSYLQHIFHCCCIAAYHLLKTVKIRVVLRWDEKTDVSDPFRYKCKHSACFLFL